MAKQEKLYTVKELSKKLNVSDKRIYQLIQKHIIDAKLPLTDHINYIPKKSYKKATLTLLKQKQKENSKFQRFRK